MGRGNAERRVSVKTRKWGWAALVPGLALVGLLTMAGQAAAPPDVSKGKEVYDKNCALCHGAGGIGSVGPTLAGAAGHVQQMGIPPEQAGPGVVKLLREGIPYRMPAFPPEILSDDDIGNLGAYLFSLPPTTGENLYNSASSCAACHGPKGIGGVAPKLTGAAARFAAQGLTKAQVLPGLIPLVRNGIPGKMPAFRHLTDGEILSIGEYLWGLPDTTWEDEFTLLHGRAPTAQDKADRDWSLAFMAATGRAPTDADWQKHYFDTHR